MNPPQPVAYAYEKPDDNDAVEQMNAQVFGCARFTRAAFLIRERCAHDPDLSLVAIEGSQIVGSVRQTRVAIGFTPALLLGPLVVRPSHKNIGIGAELMRRAVAAAKAGRHRLILLVGDLAYYGRFGFRQIDARQLILPAPADPQRILACAFEKDALQQMQGCVRSISSLHQK